MPITRSISRQVTKEESGQASRGADVKPVPTPPVSVVPLTHTADRGESAHKEDSKKSIRPIDKTFAFSGKRSASSKKSSLRAEALKKLAQAKLAEARAATALAEAEVAQIEARSSRNSDSLSTGTEGRDVNLVENWLATNTFTEEPHSKHCVDVSALASALKEAARAMRPKNFVELPIFTGDVNEWMAFKTAYLETSEQFTKMENVMRLRRSLKGVAKEAVISLFITDVDPAEILTLLEARFGRSDTLAIAEIEKIKLLPRLTDNPQDICIFASKVINIVTVIKALKKEFYLYNPESVRRVVEKMTPSIRYRWYDYAASRPEEEPDLIKLSSFFSREADLCSRYAQAEGAKATLNQNKSFRTCALLTTSQKVKTQGSDCVVCSSQHGIKDCSQFVKLKTEDRWEKAKELNLCFRCLAKRHFKHRCSYKPCGSEGCKASHHVLLHFTTPSSDTQNQTTAVAVNQDVRKALLKIVPVKLIGPTAVIETFALLDEGSSVTLLEEEFAHAIGATGPVEPFTIEGVAGARLEAVNSKRISFQISGIHSKTEHKLEARTIERLNLAHQTVEKDIVNRCRHLIDIAEDLIYKKGTPTLLIGQDNWNLIVSKKIRNGEREDPVASLTELGWVLHGPTKISSKAHVFHLIEEDRKEDEEDMDRNIENLMKHFMDLDSLGIIPRKPTNDPDERAITLLKKYSRRLADGRFETGLLWRRDELELPENRNNALKRLENIERRLDKDIKLKGQYNSQITHLLECGYAEMAPSTSHPERTWYLPHFPVMNPSKPKPRIVLDAAAKTKGISLNDMLLSGPDLLQSLLGVLMRFRQKPVAVAGDICEMFLQIRIRPEDRDALRFLWREGKRESDLKEYRMTSVIFGAASSPCTAIFIKNLNAEEYRDKYPEAAEAIIRNHYMDDYLQSFNTVEDAVRIAKEVSYIHEQAKFKLQKWASNKPEVIKEVDPQQKHKNEEVKLQDSSLSNLEKTLGLVWRTADDKLTFNWNIQKANVEVVEGVKQPTKREFLRILMSLFDPLGLITPISLPARGILQETWRLGIHWDDILPEELCKRWVDWMNHINDLKNLYLPRSYAGCASAEFLEMHVFVDASESAYAAAVYWRAVMADKNIKLSLVMAKGRVAPLKLTSIPRLELQAAVLGCRLARTVETEHDLKVRKRIFWTDSKTVLAWLRSGPRVFKPFVAHRVAEIEEGTKVNEWRWVPTALNVADDATRQVPRSFNSEHRWFAGPEFLYSSEENWPQEEVAEVVATGEERVAAINNNVKPCLKESLPEATRFSSWMRLIRSTGRVLQFIGLCGQRRHAKTVSLEAHHIKKAETLWWKASQEASFEEDLRRLRGNLPVGKNSRLRTLSVSIDEEGIIRLKSRIESAPDLPEEQRSPPILDGNSYYVRLYIAWIHKANHHSGPETVANEVRTRLWILRLKPAIRNIIKNCIKCRILRARPAIPATGDHPNTRLGYHQRPFTYVGLDYFGPFSITVGRHHEKRYVALFTCLTTRAVHLELAGSLTADSAVMALRRLMARRGCPSEIHSDNGTNFKGADSELKRAAYQAVKQEAEVRTIKWCFIPPGAPFMGGAWERLVQSVKRSLAATLNERHPKEEVLFTLLLEAEYTVNNRPLTPVSTSPDDLEALTPLHFILGGPARVPQPGSFVEADVNSRLRWRQSQRLADIFWNRWIKEYTPILQNRRDPRSRGNTPKLGDLVLLVDDAIPRNSWPKGRVTATYPGKDGVVRVIEVRTKAGLVRRATKKIIVLASEGA